MWQYVIKILLTSVLVVAIFEMSKRWTLMGAVMASLPLTSILAMIWLYVDTGSSQKVSDLSWGIFWVVIPSLIFFVALPTMMKMGWNFWFALCGSCFVTAISYFGYIKVLTKLGVDFS